MSSFVTEAHFVKGGNRIWVGGCCFMVGRGSKAASEGASREQVGGCDESLGVRLELSSSNINDLR